MERIRVPLSHGTLLLMSGATQDDWQVGSTNQMLSGPDQTPAEIKGWLKGVEDTLVFLLETSLCPSVGGCGVTTLHFPTFSCQTA